MEMHETLAFFGAFNPPTVAHIRLAEFAMREAGAQNVLFVPSKSGYIRDSQQKDFAFQDEDRLAMLDKIAKTRPGCRKRIGKSGRSPSPGPIIPFAPSGTGEFLLPC